MLICVERNCSVKFVQLALHVKRTSHNNRTNILIVVLTITPLDIMYKLEGNDHIHDSKITPYV